MGDEVSTARGSGWVNRVRESRHLPFNGLVNAFSVPPDWLQMCGVLWVQSWGCTHPLPRAVLTSS